MSELLSASAQLRSLIKFFSMVKKFRFLERLLFIHGRYSYYRMSIFLDYFLLKNFSFTFSQFWYGIYCMFSATKVYDDMMIAVFNVVYTALPPIVLALFDKVRSRVRISESAYFLVTKMTYFRMWMNEHHYDIHDFTNWVKKVNFSIWELLDGS